MKVVKSNVPDTDVASENDVSSTGEVLRNDKVNESLVKSPTEPMRLKTKYSEDSKNSSNDNSVPAVIKSSSDMDISFKSTNSKASTVSMDTVSSRSEQSEAVRTTISSDLDKLGMISKNSTMTPVRRSRRLSGATPTITPINERSRRVSGASAMSSKSFEPDEKYDTLELRNRTIIETFSPVSDFGINRNSSPRAVKRNKNSNNTPEISPTSSLGSPRTTRVDQRSPSASAISDSPMRTRQSAKKSTASSEIIEEQPTPSKGSALPKHLTPLKKVLTPKKEEIPVTPTRRSRRLSSGDVGSSEVSTPVRRSRRLSGASETLDSAPDGGLITGITPRKTPSTPRNRRHTSVRPEDIESALAIAGPAPLPTLIEEEEKEEKDEKHKNIMPLKQRGSKQLVPIAEDITEEMPEEPKTISESEQPEGGGAILPMKLRAKRKETEQLTSEAPSKRRSRRVTITTLGTDVDLFTPVKTSSSTRSVKRESTGSVGTKKKYIPVKKKTSVRIK